MAGGGDGSALSMEGRRGREEEGGGEGREPISGPVDVTVRCPLGPARPPALVLASLLSHNPRPFERLATEARDRLVTRARDRLVTKARDKRLRDRLVTGS